MLEAVVAEAPGLQALCNGGFWDVHACGRLSASTGLTFLSAFSRKHSLGPWATWWKRAFHRHRFCPGRVSSQPGLGEGVGSPGDAQLKAANKRKRLTLDEVSNVVLEGVGEGSLKTCRDLVAASKKLKLQGKTELWNHLGDLKNAADTFRLVSKVRGMFGGNAHQIFNTISKFPLDAFKLAFLPSVRSWLKEEFKTKSLVRSG